MINSCQNHSNGVPAMMGRQPLYQHKLFVIGFNLDKRIRKDHILRKVAEKIDFDFIYKEVEETYGANGNVSVPPPMILKMLLLLILYNVRSERELMSTTPNAWTGYGFMVRNLIIKVVTKKP